MEEQRRRNSRRQKALQGNRPKTFKIPVEAEVTHQNLGHFDIACFHRGALHLTNYLATEAHSAVTEL